MKFTGERYLPEVTGGIALEHRHRYLQACTLAQGKDVLDIACGEGYGSALLSRVARHVIGVDISQEAVDHARDTYNAANLEYRQGSAVAIPLDDASVDVVISFETIEHHAQHEEMFQEIKRVLRPDGILYMSSPDRVEYSEVTGYHNPYHVKELTRSEFITLISKYFKKYSIAGQRVMYGSIIGQEDICSNFVSWDATQQDHEQNGINKAIYIIVLASDVALPDAQSGILEDHIENSDIYRVQREKTENSLWRLEENEKLIKIYQDKKEQLDALYRSTVEEKENLLKEKQKILHEKKLLETSIKTAYAEKEEAVSLLTEKTKEQEKTLEELHSVYTSHSWRITEPLRQARAFLRRGKNILLPLPARVASLLCMAPICWRLRALAPQKRWVSQAFARSLQNDGLATMQRLHGAKFAKGFFLLAALLQKTGRLLPSIWKVWECRRSPEQRQALRDDLFSAQTISLEAVRPHGRKTLKKNCGPLTTVCLHVASKGNHFFQEIARLITCGFTDAGLHAHVISAETLQESDTDMARAADLHLIVAPHEYFHFLPEARIWPHMAKPLWLLNTEQAHTSWFHIAASTFDLADVLLDMDFDLSQTLSRQGWTAEHLPLGFSARCHQFDGLSPLEANTATLGLPRRIRSWVAEDVDMLTRPLQERPLDCCFFGSSVARRANFFAKNAALFARMQAYLRLVAMNVPLLAGVNTPLTTENTCSIVRRSKISLNIHQSQHSYFEWHRMVLQGIWQGALVVSEPCTAAPPFQPNVDYLSVSLEEMPQTLEYLLFSQEGQKDAEKIRAHGYSTLTQHCLMKTRLRQLIDRYTQ